MGRRYTAADDQNLASSADTVLALTSATTVKPKIYELIVGVSATPADNVMVFNMARFSADGTADALDEEPLDPDDPPALAAATGNHSVEPTYTSDTTLLNFPLNHRATFRWIAPPRGELILPATSGNGAGVKSSHASETGLYNAQIFWEE